MKSLNMNKHKSESQAKAWNMCRVSHNLQGYVYYYYYYYYDYYYY